MPGKVLAKHGIVERDGEDYRLTTDPSSLSSEERDELVRLCDEAISAYLQKRGTAVYDHRRAALGYLSGSLRYEVLKRAGFRCELCGISADERAIEVDHILPRKHGGEDDLTNLQALCFKCNANKGARDDEDFRVIREGLNARQSDCIFCELQADRVIASNALALAIRDNYPVTELHTLVIPKRHAATFFDLFEPERRAINQLLDEASDRDNEKGCFGKRLQYRHEQRRNCRTDYWPRPCALDPSSPRRCARPERRREGCDTG